MPNALPLPITVLPPVISLLRLPQVMARVGLSRSSIYQYIADGVFPPSIPIGLRARGWPEHEIDAWIRHRIQAGRSS